MMMMMMIIMTVMMMIFKYIDYDDAPTIQRDCGISCTLGKASDNDDDDDNDECDDLI